MSLPRQSDTDREKVDAHNALAQPVSPQKRTGLLRCYISRVENGHTVPSVDTLEKLARALEIPMYQLFHSGTASPDVRKLKLEDDNDWGATGRTVLTFRSWRRLSVR
jgi:hypothetical protein